MNKIKELWKKIHIKIYKIFLHIIGFSHDKTSRRLFRLFQVAIYITILVFIINLFSIGKSSFGEWGDFFGGVLNPFLTFLTFMGLLITIILQQTELKESREEFKRSADALFEQSKSLQKQNFENTFFNLIDLHYNIISQLIVEIKDLKEEKISDKIREVILSSSLSIAGISLNTKKEMIFKGREVFEFLFNYISFDTNTPFEVIVRYKTIQNHHNDILGHYFRNLYQVLKLIDNTDEQILSMEEKQKYSSILRAQLSTYELALLSINCLENIVDQGEFKNLLIRYSMLEHLPLEKIENGYSIKGYNRAFLDENMLYEYKHEKKFGKLDLNKYFGGAFGKNTEIIYNLKIPNKTLEDE